MNKFKIGRLVLFVVTVAILAMLVSVSAGAQTTRRRTPPKPLATPIPSMTGAEIISRSDDYATLPVEPPPVEISAEKPAATNTTRIKELSERVKKLESTQKSTYDEKQKRMLLNLDILTRAEQRSESLRKQLFEMIEKENSLKARLEQIENDIRPESIERALQIAGSLRPEEVRENRRKSLDAERRNLQSLLTEIQSTRTNLASSLQKSDLMVEKLRAKLEKDINDSFLTDDDEN